MYAALHPLRTGRGPQDDIIMFVRHDIVVALDASTGELLWYYIIYRSFTRPPQCVAGRGMFIIGESEWLVLQWAVFDAS